MNNVIYTKEKDRIIEKRAGLVDAHKDMLSILKEIDRIAKKYNIVYSTYAGTMLGQIRHKGFIPWDDDADIIMTRENFNKFVDAWKQEKPKNYNFYNIGEFQEALTMPKVTLKKHICEKEYWVDIFILDHVSKSSFLFRINNIKLKIIYGMICSKQPRLSVPPIKHRIYERIALFLLRIVGKAFPKKYLLSTFKKTETKFNVNLSDNLYVSNDMALLNVTYSKKYIQKSTYLLFEGSVLLCFECWDKWLKKSYKNYMELPISDFDKYAVHKYNEQYSPSDAMHDYSKL